MQCCDMEVISLYDETHVIKMINPKLYDVFPVDLPNELSPYPSIDHAIKLVLVGGSCTKQYYHFCRIKNEIQRQL